MNGRLDHPFTAPYIVQNRLMFKNSLRRIMAFASSVACENERPLRPAKLKFAMMISVKLGD